MILSYNQIKNTARIMLFFTLTIWYFVYLLLAACDPFPPGGAWGEGGVHQVKSCIQKVKNPQTSKDF